MICSYLFEFMYETLIYFATYILMKPSIEWYSSISISQQTFLSHDHPSHRPRRRFLHHGRRCPRRRRLHSRRPHSRSHLPAACPHCRARPPRGLGCPGGAVVRPLAELGLRHRYPYRPGESARRPRADRAAAALRSPGEGRVGLLQGPGPDSHRHRRKRGRPPEHRTARHRAACREVRPPPSPGEAGGRNRAGRCPARESRPHLLARGRRHRGAARTVPTRDGRTHPERARCGDGGACGGAAGGGGGTTKGWRRRTSHVGRPARRCRQMQRPEPVLGNPSLPTGRKMPEHS